MGKFLNTGYVDQVEFYLVANGLTVELFELRPYRYYIWNGQQIQDFAKETGLKANAIGGFQGFDSDNYQTWLFQKYGHLFP